MTLRIAVAGASGRMGHMLIEAIRASEDCRLAGALDIASSPAIGNDAAAFLGHASGVPVSSDLRAGLEHAQVLIDFTRPEGTLAHLKMCRELGVKAVIAESFERIHRSNLVGMGVLPLQFLGKDSWESIGIKGDEAIDIEFPSQLVPQQEIIMTVHRPEGKPEVVKLLSRIDTPIEVDYFRHGGILPYVLRELMAA